MISEPSGETANEPSLLNFHNISGVKTPPAFSSAVSELFIFGGFVEAVLVRDLHDIAITIAAAKSRINVFFINRYNLD
jgi:hypothetical protein